MKKTSLTAMAFALALAASSHLSAQTFVLPVDSGDGLIYSNANGAGTGVPSEATGSSFSYAAFVGEHYAPGGAAYIMPIQLPTLAAGAVFTSATLQTQLYGITNNGNLADADLYGIGTLAAPTVSATDLFPTSYYYQGGVNPLNSSDSGTVDATNDLLQAQFLTPASTVRTDGTTGPFTDTSTLGSSNLTAFLNAAYDGGANAGKFVFLRISYDQTPISGYNGYNVLSEEAGGSEEKPQILYTDGVLAAPEPSTYALLGGGLLVLILVQRRRMLQS